MWRWIRLGVPPANPAGVPPGAETVGFTITGQKRFPTRKIEDYEPAIREWEELMLAATDELSWADLNASLRSSIAAVRKKVQVDRYLSVPPVMIVGVARSCLSLMVNMEVEVAMRRIILAGLGLMLITGLAQAVSVDVDVVPEQPVEGDEVQLVLSAEWPDSCVPLSIRTFRLGRAINLTLVAPRAPCLPVATDWEREVSLGELDAASYEVNVVFRGESVGERAFSVVEETVEPVEEENDYWEVPEDPDLVCDNPYAPSLVVLTATMDEVAWEDALPMALVVTTPEGESDFLFSTGQRFDFVVFRGEQEVWRWSDDQAFTMAVVEETYTAEGTLYLEQLNTGALPGPGTYTLQAVLTTEGEVEADALVERGPAYACTTFEVLEAPEAPEECIDINTASFGELQEIVHIGPARAGEIIELREEEPFCCLDDLTRVSGIGSATVQNIREQGLAVVDPATSGARYPCPHGWDGQ